VIERLDELVELLCDTCRAPFAPPCPTAEFLAMISDARRDGWHIGRAGSQWLHTCPACRSEPDMGLFRERRFEF
jgi:hypothetical protein